MAARRNRKNGRFSKTTRRTNRKKAFNVSKAAETFIVSNAALRAFTGSNIPSFFLNRKIGDTWGPNGSNNSWEFTAKELIDLAMGGKGGMSAQWQELGLGKAVRKNMTDYGPNAIATAVLTPILFNVGRRVLRKPLINPANRVLKQVGIKELKL